GCGAQRRAPRCCTLARQAGLPDQGSSALGFPADASAVPVAHPNIPPSRSNLRSSGTTDLALKRNLLYIGACTKEAKMNDRNVLDLDADPRNRNWIRVLARTATGEVFRRLVERHLTDLPRSTNAGVVEAGSHDILWA